MNCPKCFDDGKGDVEMTHATGTVHFHDPANADGHGERDVCFLVCGKCGYEDECDGAHHEPINDRDDE